MRRKIARGNDQDRRAGEQVSDSPATQVALDSSPVSQAHYSSSPQPVAGRGPSGAAHRCLPEGGMRDQGSRRPSRERCDNPGRVARATQRPQRPPGPRIRIWSALHHASRSSVRDVTRGTGPTRECIGLARGCLGAIRTEGGVILPPPNGRRHPLPPSSCRDETPGRGQVPSSDARGGAPHGRRRIRRRRT
jgi:hypothetical protein